MNYLLIPLSLLVGMIADNLALPLDVAQFRPDFTLLILIYWVLMMPRLAGVGTAWVVGLLQDTLSGGWLGLHAFTKSLLAYFTLRLHLQIQIFPPWQQMAIILFYSYLEHVFVWLVRSAWVPTSLQMSDFIQPLTTALFWPLVFLALSAVKRRAKLD